MRNAFSGTQRKEERLVGELKCGPTETAALEVFCVFSGWQMEKGNEREQSFGELKRGPTSAAWNVPEVFSGTLIEIQAAEVSTQSDEAIGKMETLLEDLDAEKEELKIKFEAVEKQIKENTSCLAKLRMRKERCLDLVENHASLENETVGFFAISEELKKAIKDAKDDLKWTEELTSSCRLLKAQVREVIN